MTLDFSAGKERTGFVFRIRNETVSRSHFNEVSTHQTSGCSERIPPITAPVCAAAAPVATVADPWTLDVAHALYENDVLCGARYIGDSPAAEAPIP
jgi:hypothetical protein